MEHAVQYFFRQMQQRAVQVRRLAASVAIGASQRRAAIAASRGVVARGRRFEVLLPALHRIDQARDRRRGDQRAGGF